MILSMILYFLLADSLQALIFKGIKIELLGEKKVSKGEREQYCFKYEGQEGDSIRVGKRRRKGEGRKKRKRKEGNKREMM